MVGIVEICTTTAHDDVLQSMHDERGALLVCWLESSKVLATYLVGSLGASRTSSLIWGPFQSLTGGAGQQVGEGKERERELGRTPTVYTT